MSVNRTAAVWAITLAALAVVAATLPSFFRFIEARPGTVPPDPLIAHLAPMDLSVPVFVVLYGAILLAVLSIAGKPFVLLRALQAYLLLLLLRMIGMFTFTLEPPADLIDLVDPVTQLFYPDDRPFRKDLFFSGHTATLALLAFAVAGPRIRVVLWTATFLVGAAVILQHVHWTVDVVVAPLFAWLAWRIAGFTARITAPIPLAGQVLDVDAAGDAFGENVGQ
jgi:membrane-associated phospholipid phosphatase